MLSAMHPSPATNVALEPALAAGRGSLTVGRVEDNALSAIRLNANAPAPQQLPEKLVNMVSRRHARLEVVAGQLQLEDLGAVNGTFVNDQRIEGRSRRVLQENDVISFGGAINIRVQGQCQPNPWVYRVRHLHEFLASYVPPGQGPPPAAVAAAAATGQPRGSGAAAAGSDRAGREVYSFSPAPTAARRPVEGDDMGAPAAAEVVAAAAAGVAAGAQQGAQAAGAQEVLEVVSPEPAAGASGQPGSIPVQEAPLPPAAEEPPPAAAAAPLAAAEPAAAEPAAAGPAGASPSRAAAATAAAPGAALLAEDSEESAELAALAAYEAILASQQGSAPQPRLPAGSGGAGAAASAAGAPAPAAFQLLDAAQPLRVVMPRATSLQRQQEQQQRGPGPLPAAIWAAPLGAAAVPAAPAYGGETGLQPFFERHEPQQQQPQQQQPQQQQPQQQQPQLEMIDLTADSPPQASRHPQQHRHHQQQQQQQQQQRNQQHNQQHHQALHRLHAAVHRGMSAAGPAAAAAGPGAAAAAARAGLAGAAGAPRVGLVGAAAGAGAGAARVGLAGAGAGAADVVDLLHSPTKRRHGAGGQAEQGVKRAKPSPEGRPNPPAAPAVAADVAEAAAPAAGTAAAAAATAAAGAGPTANEMSDELQSCLICAICQELPVATVAAVPCGHNFCSECMAGWLATGKMECPSCRVKSTAQPIRQHAMDNMAEVLAKRLPEDDRKERQAKLQSFEEQRAEVERALAAPWQSRGRHGRGGGGGGGGGGHGRGGAEEHNGVLAALAATFFGGGFGGGPMLMGLGGMPPFDRPDELAWGSGAQRRRAAALPQVLPARAAVATAPPQNEFRVDVSSEYSTSRCAGCGQAIGERTTRIGMRPQPQARNEAARPYRWYHLRCLPAAHWADARVRGISNLRGIPPAEQARVREHMQLLQG